MAKYSGNLYGQRSYFVFDRVTGTGGTCANFLTAISINSTTGDYVAAGGSTYGSTLDLNQFIGNNAYLNFSKRKRKTLSSLDKSGGITTTIATYTPDPRIVVGVYVSGNSGSFTGHHMDEIHVTELSGSTYQAFLGRLTYPEQNPSIPSNHILLDLLAYGVSGSNKGSQFSFNAGNTLTNISNGIGATFASSSYVEYIPVDSYSNIIQGQVGVSLDNLGLTGVTVGRSTDIQYVFYNQNNKFLFDFVSSVLPAFAFGGSGASGTNSRQSKIFTIHAGTTTGGSNLFNITSADKYGVTFNAITGGTLGNSAFEEFAHHVIHSWVGKENNKGSLIYSISNKLNVRDIDQIAF